MLIIVGFLVVIISVIGGYLGAHGRLGALWQPYELVIIGGAALGAFLVGTPAKTVKQTLQAMVGVFKGPRYKQQDYIDVLSLLYELLNKARREGFMALEDHVERPAESALFANYPKVQPDHHLIDFITDCLRLMIGSNIEPHELGATKVAYQQDIVEQGNWKLVMENNRECYHCDGHPELACSLFPTWGLTDETVPSHLADVWNRNLSASAALEQRCRRYGLPLEVVEELDTRVAGIRISREPLDGEGESFSADGRRLYASVGSNSNVAENGVDKEKDRAAILEIDPATGTQLGNTPQAFTHIGLINAGLRLARTSDKGQTPRST